MGTLQRHFSCHWSCIHYNLSNMITLIWVLQSLVLLIGSKQAVSAASTENWELQGILDNTSQLLKAMGHETVQRSLEMKECKTCKLGNNKKMCSGSDHGECDCSNKIEVCRCKPEWVGDACQYQISKISCEKMRNCILCHVYGSGPLSDGNDCLNFCHTKYPAPIVVKNLYFQDDEHLCSFIHQPEGSPVDCRYFFKYGQVTLDGKVNPINFYIIAQQEMDCEKPTKFPHLRKATLNPKNNDSFHLYSKNYEEISKSSDVNDPGVDNYYKQKTHFITIVILFVFIALPFVACAFSLMYNFSRFPCGLCNVFRQSSSKYIRNVRPFPAFVPTEESVL